MNSEFIIVIIKFLLGILVLSILVIGIYMAMKPQTQKEQQIDPTKPNIIYILWIGNTETTLQVLDLIKNNSSPSTQQQLVIQPIFIPDPEDSKNQPKWEYELQTTRDLRKQIMEKYPLEGQRILPIISITNQQPDDEAFNQAYDQQYSISANSSDKTTSRTETKKTRADILARWAVYYNIAITDLSENDSLNQTNRKTGDSKILINTWDCRFPIGRNQVPCGLCKKCEKINQLIS